jgi:hypothetical protein
MASQQRPVRSRVYIKPHYDTVTSRWQWTIWTHDKHQAIEVARSVQTFAMERDANAAGRGVLAAVQRGLS